MCSAHGNHYKVQLKTFGKPTSVTLDVQEQTKRIFSLKLAIEIRVELIVSKWTVLKFNRKAFGTPSTEAGLKSALRDHKSMFADLVTIRRVEPASLGGVKGEHFIVYHLDVSVFVHPIAMRRGMTSDHFRVKFGVDFVVVLIAFDKRNLIWCLVDHKTNQKQDGIRKKRKLLVLECELCIAFDLLMRYDLFCPIY